ncbi:hypothetical protein QJQ45_018115, partial [Haematococcus lacustris]
AAPTDCNGALNMQRIGESKWRPLELCWRSDQVELPVKGKEYPGLGYRGCETAHPSPSSSLVPCGILRAMQQLGLAKESQRASIKELAYVQNWDRWFSTGKLANRGFQFERTVEADGVSVSAGPSNSNSGPAAAASATVAAAHVLGLPHIGKGIAEHREFVFDPATQIGVGIDPGVTQAVSAASGSQRSLWDERSGQLVAAASSLEANLKHITVTLATWDAVWEVYLDPKWARQRLRLYGAQDRALEQFFKQLEKDMAEVSIERHGRPKQLVVFFGAASIGAGGGWGADVMLRASCKVVCWPRGKDQRRGSVVLVDEHRTIWVSSVVNGKQPCEDVLDNEQPTRLAPHKPPQPLCSSQAATQPAVSETGPSTPLPAKRTKRTKAEHAAEPTQPTKGKGKAKGKAAKAKPAPQPGRWLDMDCHAAHLGEQVAPTGAVLWCWFA